MPFNIVMIFQLKRHAKTLHRTGDLLAEGGGGVLC